jgi:hypothetical protein
MLWFNSNVNLRRHKLQFGNLARTYDMQQSLPLLLTSKINQTSLEELKNCVGEIVGARTSHEIDLGRASSPEVKQTLKSLVSQNVGNVVELGDRLFPDLTQRLRRQLADCVSSFFGEFGLIQQFPNIRIKVGPFSHEQEHTFHPLSTSKMHCDVWAGAPKELHICLIEVLNVENGPKVKFAEVSKFPKALAQRLLGYDEPEAVEFLMKSVVKEYTSQVGFAHIVHTFTPHQTVYPGDGLRISIDFRFTFKDETTPEVIEKLTPSQFGAPQEWLA